MGIKLELIVYKSSGKYYTSAEVELPDEIENENSKGYKEFIAKSCPAMLRDGLMTVNKVNEEDPGFFMRLFPLNDLLGKPSLKPALYNYLFDSIDVGGLEKKDEDVAFIEELVKLSILKNGDVCPYKNYGLICPYVKGEDCVSDTTKDCQKDFNDVWFDFLTNKFGKEELL